MNILWLINIPLPEASQLMGENPSPFGGWLINASKDLANKEDVELAITFPSNKANKFRELKGKTIKYYPFIPVKENDNKVIEYNESFETLLNNLKPDIVHIYGTEIAHTLSMVNMCKKLGVETIISIQGLVSVYAQHIYANLPFSAVYGFTIRNVLRKDSVYLHKKTFELRGENEVESLENTNHIIGRTTWDKACSNQINPKANYHFCNETLREEFYKHQWSINDCEKHSIFLSQGQYPIKGLHYMLEAMPIILKKFPGAKVYISGKDITKSDSIKDKLLLTYYGKYIRKMISSLGLEEKVVFTGPLDEQKMCQRYLKSNVFVCPSSIENSPNSLGEAMVLGVPCVASDVGGVSDMLKHKEEGFVYQTDAPYMLAHYVCEIFENEDLALKFSKNAREHALTTHDRDANTRRLIEIYEEITGENLKKVE
ncbi:glycosyltransferase family 4 protein [Jeotgalibaca arthritidis]|uniref:Glycosyltransferase family 4 protein n=1 Tax=Jeotgalibaca arthritidis TaxID=1868794 RepID=A0A6G7KB00_9LACT|nr:glycosyltransferase family 4 protein [Jeotgalibaca arthritidis]QII82417.1 glycosyltransferase family 4 protein [Jeotgalibaca arthritidis]